MQHILEVYTLLYTHVMKVLPPPPIKDNVKDMICNSVIIHTHKVVWLHGLQNFVCSCKVFKIPYVVGDLSIASNLGLLTLLLCDEVGILNATRFWFSFDEFSALAKIVPFQHFEDL
jgi:hypothetical protein